MFQEIVVFYIICSSFVGFCFDFLILPLRAFVFGPKDHFYVTCL